MVIAEQQKQAFFKALQAGAADTVSQYCDSSDAYLICENAHGQRPVAILCAIANRTEAHSQLLLDLLCRCDLSEQGESLLPMFLRTYTHTEKEQLCLERFLAQPTFDPWEKYSFRSVEDDVSYPSMTLLQTACLNLKYSNSIEAVKYLLGELLKKEPASLNAVLKNGCATLTHFLLRLFVKNGVVRETENGLAWHYPLYQSVLEILNFLLTKGDLSLTTLDSSGRPPIFYSFAQGSKLGIFDLLVARSVELDCNDTNNESLYHRAARAGQGQVLKTLSDKAIERRAVKNKLGLTPLMTAVQANQDIALAFLQFKQGEVSEKTTLLDLFKIERRPESCLNSKEKISLQALNFFDCVEHFLKADYSLVNTRSETGETLLISLVNQLNELKHAEKKDCRGMNTNNVRFVRSLIAELHERYTYTDAANNPLLSYLNDGREGDCSKKKSKLLTKDRLNLIIDSIGPENASRKLDILEQAFSSVKENRNNRYTHTALKKKQGTANFFQMRLREDGVLYTKTQQKHIVLLKNKYNQVVSDVPKDSTAVMDVIQKKAESSELLKENRSPYQKYQQQQTRGAKRMASRFLTS